MNTESRLAKRIWAWLPLALWVQSCSSEDAGISEACRKQCDDTCSAIEQCEIADRSTTCVADCTAAHESADCQDATPPSQLTCSELEGVSRCANHCVAVCTRATECGEFDRQLCLEGCNEMPPVVCNAASVDARTCDQLKPEARWYEQIGRSLHDSSEVGGYMSPAAFGLCESAADCMEPQACLIASNTCGSCTTDGECERGLGQAYACSSGACLAVECTNDDDCSSGVCDSASHLCRDCRNDADCSDSIINPACNTQTLECVQCLEDAHCATARGGIYPVCNVQTSQCVECMRDEDCTIELLPRCDLQTFACAP